MRIGVPWDVLQTISEDRAVTMYALISEREELEAERAEALLNG